MARARYFCVATKTSFEIDKDNKIKVAPMTKVILYPNMDVGIKSVLYLVWVESQAEPSADNEVQVDAENNVIRLVQKKSNGEKKYTSWLAIPCRGVKWNDTFEQEKDVQDTALDFVSDMFADYYTARMKYIQSMISGGASDEQMQAIGITTEEIEKNRHHHSS